MAIAGNLISDRLDERIADWLGTDPSYFVLNDPVKGYCTRLGKTYQLVGTAANDPSISPADWMAIAAEGLYTEKWSATESPAPDTGDIRERNGVNYRLNDAGTKGSAVDPTADPALGDGSTAADWIIVYASALSLPYLYESDGVFNKELDEYISSGRLKDGDRFTADSVYNPTVYGDGLPHGACTYELVAGAIVGDLTDARRPYDASHHLQMIIPHKDIRISLFGVYQGTVQQNALIQSCFDYAAKVRDLLTPTTSDRDRPVVHLDTTAMCTNLWLQANIDIRQTGRLYAKVDSSVLPANAIASGVADLSLPYLRIGQFDADSRAKYEGLSIETYQGWSNTVFGFPFEYYDTNVGIEFLNVNSSEIEVIRTEYINIGVRTVATAGRSFGYNTIKIRRTAICRIGLQIQAIGTGWNNENRYQYDSSSTSSIYNPYGSAWSIQTDTVHAGVASSVNNHKFERFSSEISPLDASYDWSSSRSVDERFHYRNTANGYEYVVVGGGAGQTGGTDAPTSTTVGNEFTDNNGVVWRCLGEAVRVPIWHKDGQISRFSTNQARWENCEGPFAMSEPGAEYMPVDCVYEVYSKESVTEILNQGHSDLLFNRGVANVGAGSRVSRITSLRYLNVSPPSIIGDSNYRQMIGGASGWYIPGYFKFDKSTLTTSRTFINFYHRFSRYGIMTMNQSADIPGVEIDTTVNKSFHLHRMGNDGATDSVVFISCLDESGSKITLTGGIGGTPAIHGNVVPHSDDVYFSSVGHIGGIVVSESTKSIILGFPAYENNPFKGYSISLNPMQADFRHTIQLIDRHGVLSSQGRSSPGTPINGHFDSVGEYIEDSTNGSAGWHVTQAGILARPWASGEAHNVKEQYCSNAGHIYVNVTDTVTSAGTIAPTHLTGTVSDGVLDWEYVGPQAVLAPNIGSVDLEWDAGNIAKSAVPAALEAAHPAATDGLKEQRWVYNIDPTSVDAGELTANWYFVTNESDGTSNTLKWEEMVRSDVVSDNRPIWIFSTTTVRDGVVGIYNGMRAIDLANDLIHIYNEGTTTWDLYTGGFTDQNRYSVLASDVPIQGVGSAQEYLQGKGIFGVTYYSGTEV